MVADRHWVAAVALFLILAATGGVSSAAAQESELEPISSIGGFILALAVDGDVAYIGEGRSLVILDVSDAANIEVMGRFYLGEVANAIAVSGSRVLVLDPVHGLRILDVSRPRRPRLLGELGGLGEGLQIEVSGTMAYVAGGPSGLHIIDFSDPRAPRLESTRPARFSTDAVSVWGDLAYLADPEFDLEIVDVSDPTAPFLLIDYPFEGQIRTLKVLGNNKAYFLVTPRGISSIYSLQIFDTTYPTDLAENGSIDLVAGSALVLDIDVDGTFALVSANEFSVDVINVSRSFAPHLIERLGVLGRGQVEIEGTRVYTTNIFDSSIDFASARLSIFDLSSDDPSEIAGQYVTFTVPGRLTIEEDRIYAIQQDELWIVNAEDPFTPKIAGLYRHPNNDFLDVAISGTTAYLATERAGMMTVDVSRPLAPYFLDRIDSVIPREIVVADSLAYIADNGLGLRIVDAADPSNLRLLGILPTSGFRSAQGLAVSGSVAYLGLGGGDFGIVDVSDPTSPRILGVNAASAFSQDVAFDESAVYVLDGSSLLAFDVREPKNPDLIGQVLLGGGVDRDDWQLDVERGYAFAAIGNRDLRVFDVTDPSAPIRKPSFRTDGDVVGVEVSGGLVAMSERPSGNPFTLFREGPGGITLFRFPPLALPDPVAPVIADPGDIIVGNLEASAPGMATQTATAVQPFVFPDALGLDDLVFDDLTPDAEIKWSFTGGEGRIAINGVGPVDASLAGEDDPRSPRSASRIDLNDLDPAQLDGEARTITVRNVELSPIRGETFDPGIDGILTTQTTTITLFASDCTTFSARLITVFTANATSDALSAEGFTPAREPAVFGPGTDWIGGVTEGMGSTSVNGSGICMTVPGPGANDVAWVSPERYFDLVDNRVYRARVSISTTQSDPDAIPLFVFAYDNVNLTTTGGGNNWGGFQWVLDVDGGAQGIGRNQGRDEFDFWFAPGPVGVARWRAGAFKPEADAENDPRLIFRIIDTNERLLAQDDSGTICIATLSIESIPRDRLIVEEVAYDAPIDSTTHFAVAFTDPDDASEATIDDLAGRARIGLTASGNTWRTLGPYDPVLPTMNEMLYPVPWLGNTLYRARLRMRAESSEADPVDAVLMAIDVATNELGAIGFTTRGAPGSWTDRIGSPKLEAAEWEIYFYSQNATASVVPQAARLRPLAMFFNTIDLFGDGTGGDALLVQGLALDRLRVPE